VDLRIRATVTIHELEVGSAHRKMLCQTNYVWAQDDVRIDTAKWTRALNAIGLSASILVEIPFPLESDSGDERLKRSPS
jgi:hypothetical protein